MVIYSIFTTAAVKSSACFRARVGADRALSVR
jgi:hypothetical protein